MIMKHVLSKIVVNSMAIGFSLGTGSMAVLGSLLGTSFVYFLFSAVALYGAVYLAIEFLQDVRKMERKMY